jgi:hypothetical protein
MSLTEEQLAEMLDDAAEWDTEWFLSDVTCKRHVRKLVPEVRRLRRRLKACATGPWQTGPAPKDGSLILGIWGDYPYVAQFQSDGEASAWVTSAESMTEDPTRWARIMPVEAKP